MKIRVGKEQKRRLDCLKTWYQFSANEVVRRSLCRCRRLGIDLATVEPESCTGGGVYTVSAPDGVDQDTIRKALWVCTDASHLRPPRRRFKSEKKEGRDYIIVPFPEE